MMKPDSVEPLDGYAIWIKYPDGVEGRIDLAHLAGRGVFQAWEDREFFEGVGIDEYGAISWSEDIDLCPDSLYMKLTGLPFEQVIARAESAPLHA